jgi:hypothetical protein
MSEVTEEFTREFNYSLKDGVMTLSFFCDCCKKPLSVSKKLDQKKISSNDETCNEKEQLKQNKECQEVFKELQNELKEQLYKCSFCGYLVCNECWEQREDKCKSCPACNSYVKLEG